VSRRGSHDSVVRAHQLCIVWFDFITWPLVSTNIHTQERM